MSIDLEAINRRYEAALEARPAKGEWTSVQAAILADSVADVKPRMREVEELREQIAQEIEVHMRRNDKAGIGVSAVGDEYANADRIARGRTRGSVELVVRCERCGCDLWYPTAAHVVDCGTRKEQRNDHPARV